MNLEQAFSLIASSLNLDAQQLMEYADEDQIGGYHREESLRRWPSGSVWEVEGKIWYALVRALKPDSVVEIGVKYGCSTTHILAALDVNNRGKLTSFDVNGDLSNTIHDRWEFHFGKVIGWTPEAPIDLVIEDGWHTYEDCLETLTYLQQFKPRVLVSHDASHEGVGPDIQRAWHELYGDDYTTVLVEPSDCGFCWRVQK